MLIVNSQIDCIKKMSAMNVSLQTAVSQPHQACQSRVRSLLFFLPYLHLITDSLLDLTPDKHVIPHSYSHAHNTHKHSFSPYQTQVVQSCMIGVVWCSCLLVQCSKELELFRGTRQRSAGLPLCSTPQQHSTRRNSFLMSLLRSV